jgi:hypothetical protein
MDKKQLIKDYKRTIQPMGVYQIKNLVSGKIFIGSGKNLHGKIRTKVSAKSRLTHE